MAEIHPAARVEQDVLQNAAFLHNPRLQTLLVLLGSQGEEARVAGGAIRNALLGAPVSDVDIATTALPDVVIARANAAGLRTIPTGIEHGTVSIGVEGEFFEVTTLREDIETDGRRAVVRFGRDFEADALRRDFTINALSVSADGRLFDYCNGLADIASRRVRFIGDADKRIREDFLRILRLFRFHAAYGEGAIDAAALDAATRLQSGLDTLSRERVHMEIFKLLVARHAPQAAQDMLDCGILGRLLNGIANPARLHRIADIEAARSAAPDAALRMIALCVEVDDDQERLRERLRLSNAQSQRLTGAMRALAAMRSMPGKSDPPPPSELFRLLFLFGRRSAMDAIILAHASSRAQAQDASWLSAANFLRDTPEPRLPFTGEDLIQRGLESGPAIGVALKRLQALWIRAGFPREPDVLGRLLDETLTSKRDA